MLNTLKRATSQNRVYQFWSLNVGFWLGVSLITFLTLTVWYQQFYWSYIAHTLLQSVMGILLSLPLYWVSMRIWDHSLVFRGFIHFCLVALMALVWTIIRLNTFIWMTQEQGLWADFGGWYFGSVYIFLCWTITFHGIRYYQLLQSEHKIMLAAEAVGAEEHIKRISAQNVARDAQLKMLRYQLNPHFLCNTLNAVNALVEFDEAKKAQRMIVQLSKFLRYSLDNNPDTKIALEKEVGALKLYLEIEKTRFGDRLSLDFKIEERAKLAGIPSLLLQPLIENSMKHAIAQSEQGGTISFSASVSDNKLILELCDTGSDVKIQHSKILSFKGRGVGLRNTDERLATLYPDNYDFILKTLPSGGLKTTIKIPYEPIIDSANERKLAV
ncbi:MAG: two-component system LytT family sensor kinase [Paraglaciecola sp.]